MTAQPFPETTTTGLALADPNRYIASCPSCAAVADVSQSPWCDCVTKERTPVCTTCGECRCKSSFAQRRDFWLNAPQVMRDRRSATGPRRLVAQKAPLVMLVDDDEEIRLIGQHVIEKLGYRCITAENGPDALAMLAVEEPRIVITDALMPKMDGRDLCRFVKHASSAKVVIMTSLYTAPRYKYEAYKRFGADEYLAKPIDFRELQSKLERLLT